MSEEELIKILFSKQDLKFRDFLSNLTPNVDKEKIIGVRTPELRKIAKNIFDEKFLSNLPHQYFEENQIHSFNISLEKDYEKCLIRINAFLPYIDNWAVCDQLSPKVFNKNHDKLICEIDSWLSSNHVYTLRFGIEMLMSHYLDDDFDVSHLEKVANVKNTDYYVEMMMAWYFATALAKHEKETLKFIESNKLRTWVHNKTIQKAIESNRISSELKTYLKTLKRKEK